MSGTTVLTSLNPFATEYVTLRTRLKPEECVRRLQASTLPWTSTILVRPLIRSTLPLKGWVSSTGFAVRKKHGLDSIGLNDNDMQPEAKACFAGGPDGTRMRVRLATRRWVLLWYGCSLPLITLSLLLLCRLTEAQCRWYFVLGLPGLLAGGLVYGRWQARDEAMFLVGVLKRTLDAEDLSE